LYHLSSRNLLQHTHSGCTAKGTFKCRTYIGLVNYLDSLSLPILMTIFQVVLG